MVAEIILHCVILLICHSLSPKNLKIYHSNWPSINFGDEVLLLNILMGYNLYNYNFGKVLYYNNVSFLFSAPLLIYVSLVIT